MASIIQFIEKVGLKNIKAQPLNHAVSGVKVRENGATLTVETDVITSANLDFFGDDISLSKLGKSGVILWMDSEKFDEVVSELAMEENLR